MSSSFFPTPSSVAPSVFFPTPSSASAVPFTTFWLPNFSFPSGPTTIHYTVPTAFPPTASSVPENSGSFRTDTSTELLWREQSVNAAGYLAAIAWGLYLGIFYKAIVNILKNRNRTNLRWLPFLGALFATATVSMCCYTDFNEQAWIDQRNYPGGALAFLTEQQHIPVYIAAVAASLVTQFLGQAFLAYRCHALWNRIWITIPLALWVLANLGLAISYCVILASSSVHFSLLNPDAPLALSKSSVELAMSFNIIVSVILLSRLIYLAPKIPTSFPNYLRKKFVRVDAILVESVLFLGVMSLVYVSLFGEEGTGANLFLPFIVQLEAIFPTLIIIRIVQEHGWEAGTIYKSPTDFHHSYARGVDIVGDNETINEKVFVVKTAGDAA